MAINKKRELKGFITADNAVIARKNKQPLTDVLDTDIITVESNTLVSDILPLIYDSPTPIAVVNPENNNRLLGVIIRGSVIEALADTTTDMEVVEHA